MVFMALTAELSTSIVDIEDKEGVGEGVDFEAHDVVGRNDV